VVNSVVWLHILLGVQCKSIVSRLYQYDFEKRFKNLTVMVLIISRCMARLWKENNNNSFMPYQIFILNN